jgi:Dna[CI] antecedent, DciA
MGYADRRMRRAPRKSLAAPEPLDAIMSRAGENRFARSRPPLPPKVWRDAVGARIAERACPVSLEGGVLLLRVPSSVWAHELSLLSDDICGRLRVQGTEVRGLRFRVGPVPPVDRPPERRTIRAVPSERTIPPELLPALERVGDAALRESILRAAGANLAWQTFARPADKALVNEARRAALAPRSAGEGSAPPGRESLAVRADARRTPSTDPDRSR